MYKKNVTNNFITSSCLVKKITEYVLTFILNESKLDFLVRLELASDVHLIHSNVHTPSVGQGQYDMGELTEVGAALDDVLPINLNISNQGGANE